MKPNNSTPPPEDPVRHHVYDGIQEYDKRLPNWWLLTFYGAIVFSIIYWLVTQHFPSSTDESRLHAEMAAIETAKLASSSATLDDATLWKMSRNPAFVDAGKITYNATCASCHNAALTGGIGPNLLDEVWIHGGRPTEVLATVTDGVLVKGMPGWGPVLGSQKVSEVVAFIMSRHDAPGGAK
ncbi:MAG: c-type cytochrome [Verrucomicrobia bacterium]|nr:c-type cytochrome [Verrucomicrobiota bacterium]